MFKRIHLILFHVGTPGSTSQRT